MSIMLSNLSLVFFHRQFKKLPFNFVLTIAGLVCLISSFQFTQFMTLIREMIGRVETEQKVKLQQLKQMQEETKYVIIFYIHCICFMLNLGLFQRSLEEFLCQI